MPLHDIPATIPAGGEIGYDQITASVTVSATTESSGTTVITSSSYYFDGHPVMCEFFAPIVTAATVAAAVVIVSLFEGSTQIGRFGATETPTGTNNTDFPFVGLLRFTPTAGYHTYKVTAHESGGSGSVVAGVGGTAAYNAAFLRFVKV